MRAYGDGIFQSDKTVITRFPKRIQKENENMSRKNEPITVESLNKEISTWVEDDKEGNGAWNMFTLFTLKDM